MQMISILVCFGTVCLGFLGASYLLDEGEMMYHKKVALGRARKALLVIGVLIILTGLAL